MDPPRQDSFNQSVSTLLERKVRGWLSGVISDMRRRSPVQQWLDSIPDSTQSRSDNSNEQIESSDNTVVATEIESSVLTKDETKDVAPIADPTPEESNLDVPSPKELWKRKSLESGVITSSPNHEKSKKLQRDYSVQSEGPVRLKNRLLRDASLQSDASGSSGSSVHNVLGARKVDAESVLLALGFGPSEKQQKLQRIPDRFLVPSKLKGISTERFIKDEQLSMRMHDCGVFGYRGLTGNPHAPPSTIVAKIMDRILQDDVCREQASLQARHSVADIASARALLAARRLRDS